MWEYMAHRECRTLPINPGQEPAAFHGLMDLAISGFFGGYGFDGNSSGILNDLWKISSFAGMLPLHLLQFSGVLNNETVRLQWQS